MRLALQFLPQVEATQNVGKGIAQRKGTRPHLQHAQRVALPRSCPFPKVGAPCILHAEPSFDGMGIALALDPAGCAPVGWSRPLRPFLDQVGQPRRANQRQRAVAPDGGAPFDDGDALQGGQWRQPDLETVQDGDHAGLGCVEPAWRKTGRDDGARELHRLVEGARHDR
jgi:hypothetical protein